MQELDRLENSCPRRAYTTQEQTYCGPKSRFAMLALMTATWRAQDDLLAMLALVILLCEEGEGLESQVTVKAGEAFRSLMQKRAGKRAGWKRFCAEIGISADAVTRQLAAGSEWAMGVAEGVYDDMVAIGENDLALEEATAKREHDALTDMWRERVAGRS